MESFTALDKLFTPQAAEIPVLGFLISMALAALLAHLLGQLYVRCGRAVSNRRDFAQNFMLLTVTTLLVISVVKSSLALSLGLVGALSIVRFRAAIKEPEELAYLFLAIAVGLGLGAEQWEITLVAFAAISGLILLKHRMGSGEERQNLFLTISSDAPDRLALDDVVAVLSERCSAASVTRFDESSDALEAAFLVEFDDFAQLSDTRRALQELGESLTISFMDAKGVA